MRRRSFPGFPPHLEEELEELRRSGIDLSSLGADEFLSIMRDAEERHRRKERRKIHEIFDRILDEHEKLEEEHEKVHSFVYHLAGVDMEKVKEILERIIERED